MSKISPTQMSDWFVEVYENARDVEEFVDILLTRGVTCDREVLMAIWYLIDSCKMGAI